MEALETFRGLYSDAQMIIPNKVLAATMDVNAGLGEAYGKTKRLERRLQIELSGGRSTMRPHAAGPWGVRADGQARLTRQ